MVFVIAEAGVNHNGDMDLARRLIDAAHEAKADAVKFQTYSAEKLEPPGPRRDMLAACQLSHDCFRGLRAYCDEQDIEFMSTPFDVESLNFLVSFGVKRIKIASGQASNWRLVRAAVMSGLPLIVSLGMGQQPVLGNSPSTWLHCLSAYPAPAADMNLKAMVTKAGPYGLSDHTLGTTAAIAATALGASVIEKHITLDRSMEGPDHHMSTMPNEFRHYVECIRETELMLGDGIKRIMPSEAATVQIVKEREAWRSRAS